MKDELFAKVVGQERAKRQLKFYLDSYNITRIFPNMIFNAPKGMGKTTIATETAKGLVTFTADGQIEMAPNKKNEVKPKRKTFLEINCSTIKNIKQFINSTVIPFIQDKDVTVFLDEASEIPNDVTQALLTILNPNPENRTTFVHDDYVCEFDFRRQTFLLATSEPQRIFHSLLDRLTRIDLEEYSAAEMAKIIQKGAPDVSFKDEILPEVAMVLRGNARAAQKMANNIKTYLRNREVFGKKDWAEMKDIFGIIPLGLNPTELQILRLIAGRGESSSLTSLAAQTGLSREAIQRDYEMYLLKNNLISIGTGGRNVTPKGLEYLRELINPVKKVRSLNIIK